MDRVSQPLCFSLKVLYQVCIAHFRGPMHASTSHQRWLHWSGKLQGQLHLRFKSYLSLQSRIYSLGYVPKLSQGLKIVQKVAFNIESYVYILSGQKLIKHAKNGPIGEFLKTWGLRSNSVTSQVTFNSTKNGEKCQNTTFWVIFKHCVTLWYKMYFLVRQ